MTVRFVEEWVTVAVTALPPGWRNIFKSDDAESRAACPAVLLQELRTTTRYEDMAQPDGTDGVKEKTVLHKSPYETRVVFADYGDGGLEPAEVSHDYVGTVEPEA